jgi:hypothetical protein
MKDLIVGLNMPKLKKRKMEEPDLIQKAQIINLFGVWEAQRSLHCTWIGPMLQWAGMDWTD